MQIVKAAWMNTSSVLSVRVVSQGRDDIAKRRQRQVDGRAFFETVASGARLVSSLATGQVDQIDQRRLGHLFSGVVLVLLHERNGDDRVSATEKFNRRFIRLLKTLSPLTGFIRVTCLWRSCLWPRSFGWPIRDPESKKQHEIQHSIVNRRLMASCCLP